MADKLLLEDGTGYLTLEDSTGVLELDYTVPASSPELTGSILRTNNGSTFALDITAKGGADYMVPNGNELSYKRKNIATSLLGVPTSNWSFKNNNGTADGYICYGQDGKPSTADFSINTLYGGFTDPGQTWSVTAPAGLLPREFELMALATFGSSFEITATLSDGSVSPLVLERNSAGSGDFGLYRLRYAAGSDGQTLTISVKCTGSGTWIRMGWIWLGNEIASGGATTVTVSNNTGATAGGVEDTELNQFSPTANSSTDTQAYVDTWAAPNNIVTMALRIPIPAAASTDTVRNSKLKLWLTEKSDVESSLVAHEILRSDTNIAQATYNEYKTGSSWATGGAQGSGTDRSISGVAVANVRGIDAGVYVEFKGEGLAAMIQNAVTNSLSSILLNIQFTRTFAYNSSYVRFRSSEGTDGQRPELTYELVSAGGGGQSVTGTSRFNNSNTFYSGGTVTPGEVSVTGTTRFDNVSTFYSGVISATIGLSGTRFDNTSTFYAGSLTASVGVTGTTRFDNVSTFYSGGVVTPGLVTLEGTRFDNTNTFYSGGVISQGADSQNVTGTVRFDNANTFYSGAVSTTVSITGATRFDNVNTFYNGFVTTSIAVNGTARFDNANLFNGGSVTPSIALSGTRFDNANTFYSGGVISPSITINGTRFDNTNIFYSGVVSPGLVTITGTSRFDNTNTFGNGVVSLEGGNQTILGTRFDNATVFYSGGVISVGPVTISGTRFDNVNTFYTGGVVTSGGAPQTVSGVARFNNSPTFYSGQVIQDQVLAGTRFDNANTFYSGGVVVLEGDLQTVVGVIRFSNENTFFTGGNLSFNQVLEGTSRFDNVNLFYVGGSLYAPEPYQVDSDYIFVVPRLDYVIEVESIEYHINVEIR